ncbi:MAG TPA: FtsQ-type POTRA domain-containing protein [Acidimicrobiales bacterium]|nr:FtsQ-type POTRA domain-containing protein [Acidimicrobiales bacterium]
MLVFVGLMVLGVTVGAVTQSPLLDVDRVDIEGSSHTGGEAIRRVGRVEPGRLMLDVHPGPTARAIEALPWVERARVVRDWPGTVRVVITERAPAAVIARPPGGYALVDADGRVLRSVPTVPAGLLAVRNVRNPGPPGTTVTGKVRAAVAVAAAVPTGLRDRIEGVGVATDGFHLGIRGGGVVRLGGTDQLGAKLRAVLTVLTRVPARDLAILDVRVPRAPVLTRR